MNERIKKLRKALNLTQQKFADRIGIKGNAISQYESGRNEPIDAVISLICREFNVSEEWLRTGVGEMFMPENTFDLNEYVKRQGMTELETEILKAYLELAPSMRTSLLQHFQERLQPASDTGNVGAPNPVEEPPEPPKKVVKMPKARKNGGMVEIKVYDQPAAAGLGNYLDEPDFHMEYYPEDVIHPHTDFGVLIDGDSMEPKVHDGGTVFVESMQSIEPGQIGIFVLNGKSYCKKLAVDHEKRQVRLISLNKKYDDIIVGEFDSFRTLGRVRGQFTRGQPNDIFGW